MGAKHVVIARAIVNEPEILLMNHCIIFVIAYSMQVTMQELQSRLGITFIFVTHDQEEALALSDFLFDEQWQNS